MKRLIFTLTTLAILVSCKSVDKMVEQGKYDEAILFAAEKMQGKENKKTKYVKGLEKAFAKVTKEDMDRIAYLQSQGQDHNWDRIHQVYSKIKRRQERITPFLPLISKDGYKADFRFVNTIPKLREASEKASAYHYVKANEHMEFARKGDKLAAREAMTELETIERYFEDYKDKRRLKDEAQWLGTSRVLVKMKNVASVIIPTQFEREVLSISVRDLNSRWTEYFLEESGDIPIDVIAELNLTDMDVSPEREFVRVFIEEKQVKDGTEFLKDSNGKVVIDSSGQKIEVDRFKTIRADVTEIRRNKEAIVRGNLVFVDQHTKEKIRTRPITVEAVFDDYHCTYNGDRNAITTATWNRINRRAELFPSDLELTLQAATNLKYVLKRELDSKVL